MLLPEDSRPPRPRGSHRSLFVLVAVVAAAALAIAIFFGVTSGVPRFQMAAPPPTNSPGASATVPATGPAIVTPTPTPTPTPTATAPTAPGDGSPTSTPDGQTSLAAGSTNAMTDAAGNLALPLPTLSDAPVVTPVADGATTVTFGVGFDVANTSTTAHSLEDEAIVRVMVSASMGPGGPIRLNPLYSKILIDSNLDSAHVQHSYTFTLPPSITTFLKTKGLGSSIVTERIAALQYIDIDVQHMSDFKKVDGKWDWMQGTAWTAADLPIKTAITHDSKITVTNSTGDGVWNIDGAAPGDPGPDVQIADTSSYGTDVVLSGQPVQCIDQGNGSNPEGFAMLNGWDIAGNLPAGTVPPGASVTEQVNSNDSLGQPTEGAADDLATGAVQVAATVGDVTTPGLKSATTALVELAVGGTEATGGAAIALGLPIIAIAGLADEMYQMATDSCADDTNIFNLTAVEPSGAQASYSWASSDNGLSATFNSASNKGSAVSDNVQLAASTGIISLPTANGPLTGHPYLAQDAVAACGGSTGTATCTSSTIDLKWSMSIPCPREPGDCTPQQSDLAPPAPQISVPGTSLCGVNNELCPTVAAPVADASDITGSADLTGTEGSTYAVLKEWQPEDPDTGTSDPVTALAVDAAGNVYEGTKSGNITEQPVTGASVQINFTGSQIEALTVRNNTLYYSAKNGSLGGWALGGNETNQNSFYGASTSGLYVKSFSQISDGAYAAMSDNSLKFLFDSNSDMPTDALSPVVGAGGWLGLGGASDMKNQTVTSMTSNATYLFVGFSGGSILTCVLDRCGSSWHELHSDAFQFAIQTMTSTGNTLYLGGSLGEVAQINATTGDVLMLQGEGTRKAQIAGMAVAGGALYIGGCLGIQSPVTGDLLGVSVLTDIVAEANTPGVSGFSPDHQDDCQDPTHTVDDYDGFDPTSYSMVVSQPHDDLPAVVYVAFTIQSHAYVYALENLAPATPGLCIQSAGDCPPAATVAPRPVATPRIPSTSLGELSTVAAGSPQIVSTCGRASFTTTDAGALTTSSPTSTITTDGFALTTPTSATSTCTSTFAWNLNDVNSFAYSWFSANMYRDQSTATQSGPSATVSLGASSGWSAGPVSQPSNQYTSGYLMNHYLTTSAADALKPYAFPYQADAPETPTTIGGTQLLVPLTGASVLVLTITSPAGSDGTNVTDFADDTLTTTAAPPSLTPLIGASPPTCAAVDQGLSGASVSVWPLDDTDGIARDVSGNGNNGLVYEPAATNQNAPVNVNCLTSGGMLFGPDSFINAPTPSSAAATGAAFTVVSWFRLSGTETGNPRIVANDHTDITGHGFQLALKSDPDGGVTSGFFDVGASSIGTATWTAALNQNQWYQYVGTYDGTSVRAYIDGQQVGSTGTTTGSIQPGSNNISLGYNPVYIGDHVLGTLANIAVLPTGLDAAALALLYDNATGAAAPPPPTPVVCTAANQSLAAKAAAIWLLNDQTVDAVDSSGNHNGALIQHPGTLDQTPGPFADCPDSGSLALDGTSSSVTALPSVNPATTGAELTVVSWFKLGATQDSAANTNPRVVANDHTDKTGNGFQLALQKAPGGSGVTSGFFDVGTTGGGGNAAWKATLVTGAWYQYVGVYDGTTVSAYLDGVLVGAATATGSVTAGANNVGIGYNPAYNGDYLNADIANVALVPTGLNATQVMSLFTDANAVDAAPDAPDTCNAANDYLSQNSIAYWKLNDTTPTMLDNSGHSNSATEVDPGAAEPGQTGPILVCPQQKAIGFDVPNSLITAPPAVSVAATGTAFTVVSWFRSNTKPASGTTSQPAIVQNNSSPAANKAGFQLGVDFSTSPSENIISGFFSVAAAGGVGTASWSKPIDGGWHQYVGSYDGTTVSEYIDGALVATGTTSGAMLASSSPISIENQMNGIFADVAIMNTVIPAAEVTSLWRSAQGFTP